jgi:hypothetical protein
VKTYPRSLKRIYPPFRLARLRASSRDVSMMEPRCGEVPEMRRLASKGRRRETACPVGAAPARGVRNPAPGRPRVAVRPHYEGLPSMAARGADEGRRKLPGSGGQELAVRARKLRPRGQKSRDGAPRGARVLGCESAARRKTGAPLGAPSPRHIVGGRLPRPPVCRGSTPPGPLLPGWKKRLRRTRRRSRIRAMAHACAAV